MCGSVIERSRINGNATYLVVRGEELESSEVQAYLRELEACDNMSVVLDLGSTFVSGGGELRSFPWESRLPLHLMNTEGNITSVGHNFLRGNTSLTEIHLIRLDALATVGHNFLCACTSLAVVNFTGLVSLTTAGEGFLARCTSLAEVNFAGLGSLETVGHDFLCACTSLAEVNFTGLVSLTTVAHNFLGRCDSLSVTRLTGLDTVSIFD